MVCRSASAWHGWCSGESMFTTGTVACSANPLISSSLPVRRPISAEWRERMYAVSRTDSPRVSCISSGRRIIGCPPSSKTPDSNDVRVRVDGLLNTSATVRPSSAREEWGACLSEAARWSSSASRSASNSAPVMKCWGAGIDLEPLPRTEPEPHGDLAPERVRRGLERLGMGRRAAAGGAAVVAADARTGRAGRRSGTSSRHATSASRSGRRSPAATRTSSSPTAAGPTRSSSAARRSRSTARSDSHGGRSAATRTGFEPRTGWIVNLHASTHREAWARRDTLRALEAFPAPFLFGGDVNLHGKPELPGLIRLGGNHVDHLYSAERTAPQGRGAGSRTAVGPPAGAGHPLMPKPRSISSARSPAVPGFGSTPSDIAAA